MSEENEKGLDVNEVLEEPEEILDEDGTDTTDWKKLALENFGRAKRYQTDLKGYKATEAKAKEEAEKAKTEAPKSQDKKEFDLAEKSYLLGNGIKKDEFPFVLEEMTKTGKSMDEILESKYFQAQLAENRELAASKEAIPTGTNRSGNATRDTVDYWIAKGEMPPEDQVELRRKVVNARIEKEKQTTKFTSTPVVK